MKGTRVDPALHSFALQELSSLTVAHPIRQTVTLEWRTYRVTAGRAHLKQSLITLSVNLCINEERVRGVLLHEYAHLMVYDRHGASVRPHGLEWKQAMKEMGEPPLVRHSFEVVRNTKRTVALYQCERCKTELALRKRLRRGVRYAHVNCGGKLKFLGHAEVENQ
ncbi:MAG: SprT-like domain-containing protein [Fimbriimonadaceae bacterium]